MSILPNISNLSMFSFLLVLIIVSLSIFRSQISNNLQSIMPTYIISIITHLKWAWEILFKHSLFSHRIHQEPEICEELRVAQYRSNQAAAGVSDDEAVACPVCLCKIEEGDEIRELRCDHRFHKVCLDTWVGHKRTTCPVCRDSLASGRAIVELGMQVLVFQKFSSVSSTERDTWWLR